jgi:type I restriction enzyme S subunit
MELKPGYKQTEVGVIPEDWEVRRLSDLEQIRSGIAKNSNASLSNPVTAPYLRVANVQDGFLDLGEVSSISIGRDDLERYLLRPGDVLMNEGGDLDKLGRGAIWRGELKQCIHQNHVFAIRCTAALLPEFLNVWASGKVARRYFVVAGKQTTNLASINKTAIGGLPIALPSPREQQKIFEAIDSLSAHEASIEVLIAKKSQVKQAAMQELLTGKQRLPGFEGEWERARLGELFKFKNGLNKAKDFFGKGTPIVNYMDVFNSSAIYVSALRGRVLLTKQERQAFDVCKGDVFFTRTSETREDIGVASVVLSEVADTAFSGFLLRARPINNRLEHGFKAYCFQSEELRAQIVSKASYTTRALTNGKTLSEVKMLVPPPPEQLAIANVLADMDAELSALEKHLCKACELKQGMMQQLLTGKIRLT